MGGGAGWEVGQGRRDEEMLASPADPMLNVMFLFPYISSATKTYCPATKLLLFARETLV